MPSFGQKIKKALYPIIMQSTKSTSKGQMIHNEENVKPVQSFYELTAVLNNSKPLHFSELKGKKILLVNTASNCGFTGQYAELQTLYKQYEHKLTIIGFPANDFKEQEKGSDADIAAFCQLNYGVSFPLVKKSVVVKQPDQQEVFKWLTDSKLNGWNEQPPDWNFSKYLVNEEGVLTHYFGPAVSPVDAVVVNAINK